MHHASGAGYYGGLVALCREHLTAGEDDLPELAGLYCLHLHSGRLGLFGTEDNLISAATVVRSLRLVVVTLVVVRTFRFMVVALVVVIFVFLVVMSFVRVGFFRRMFVMFVMVVSVVAATARAEQAQDQYSLIEFVFSHG